MFSLQLFGVVCLSDETGPLSGPASHRHRLALLALLAAHGDGLSRDKLVAYLWSERDEKHGRNLLKQAVHVLRSALCEDAILAAGDELRLNPRVVRTDLAEFEESVVRDDGERAVRLYRGEFLDGFFLRDAPEFERWANRERVRLADTYARVLETLAERAEAREDYGSAIASWKARAARDPYDSRVALRLVRALHASGNRAGALRHAAMHEQLLRNDLGIDQRLEFHFAEPLPRDPRAPFRPPDHAPNGMDVSQRATSAGELRSRPAQLTGRTMPYVRYGMAALMLVAVYAGIRVVRPRAALQTSDGAVAVAGIGHDRAAPSSDPTGGRTSRARKATQSLAAYELYVRSTDQSLFRSDSGVQVRLQLLREAIALDSGFAAAWAGLGITYARMMVPGTTTTSERQRYHDLAEQAARKAIALDDSLAEAHTTMGVMGMMSFDLAAGERELLCAIELDPRRAMPHEKLVELYLWLGRPAAALAHAHRALEIDPLSPTTHAERAMALLGNDRCDEALAELDTISQFRPVLLRSASIAGQCYARLGRWVEAIAVLRALAESGEPTALAQLAYMYARSGNRRKAREIRDGLFDRWRRGAIGAYALVVADVGLGDLPRAMIWLDRSITDRSLVGAGSNPAHLMLVGPLFEDLRRRPEFERVRSRLGILATGKPRT